MTREDIIRMAADCEFPMAIKHTDKLVSFAALVAAAEREQVSETQVNQSPNPWHLAALVRLTEPNCVRNGAVCIECRTRYWRSNMTLFELMTQWRTDQAYKHEMRDPEGYAERNINDMSNYEFLAELSAALEEVFLAKEQK